MKLMMFEDGAGASLGAIEGDQVVKLKASDVSLPNDLLSLIEGGEEALARAQAAIANAPAAARSSVKYAKPALPISSPEKFVCVGLNYALHAKEGGHEIPTYPSFFLRVASSLVAAEAPVIRPNCSEKLDYECELAIVIGKGGRHISEENALNHVFGYTLFNDVSVRDYQRKSSQWTAGKNFDGTGPCGPCVVTSDALPAGASGLQITTRVNGQRTRKPRLAQAHRTQPRKGRDFERLHAGQTQTSRME